MSDKGITLEGLAAAVDALRQELATWKALAHKQDQLSADQITATQSGVTAAAVQQIGTNTDAIATKAADSEVVHLAGAETITGDKTFTGTNRFGLSLYQKGFSPRASAPSSNEFGRFGITDTDNSTIMSINYANRTTGARDLTFRVYDSAGNVNGAGVFKGANNSYSFCSLDPNNTISLGNSGNQWSSVYAQTYYYNGTAWGLDKDNVWTGVNTFSSTLKQVDSTVTKGAIPQSDTTAFSLYWGGTGVSSLNNALFAQRGYINADGSTLYALYVIENAAGGTHTQFGLKYDPNDTVNKRYAYLRGDFRPYANNSFNLGTSTNKWKTLNGINPGALSFPNLASAINIASSITNTAGGDNFYTAPSDGWVSVIVVGTSNLMVFAPSGNTIYYGSHAMSPDNEGYTWCSIPVPAGYRARIRVNGTVNKALFLPCLGNV